MFFTSVVQITDHSAEINGAGDWDVTLEITNLGGRHNNVVAISVDGVLVASPDLRIEAYKKAEVTFTLLEIDYPSGSNFEVKLETSIGSGSTWSGLLW